MTAWPALSEILENEHAYILASDTEAFQLLGRQPLREKLRTVKTWTLEEELWPNLRLLLTPKGTILSEINGYYRQLIAQSRRPVRQRIPVPKPSGLYPNLTGLDPMDRESLWKYERMKTDCALLEVALAVRLHYLEHGRYPVRPREISPQWLSQIPRDLWDQPIAYRLKDGKPLIYSLGPDGKDDGGKPADPIDFTPASKGDLVLGRLSRRLRSR